MSLNKLDKKSLLKIEKLLEVRDKRIDFARNHHKNTNNDRMDFTDVYLHDIYNSLAEKIILQSSVQSGKMAPLDSLVHTPRGWVRMGDVAVGDEVSTPDGANAKVIGVFPHGTQPIYKVTLSDGRCVEVGGPHLWKVFAQKKINKPCRKGDCFVHTGEEVLSTIEILERMGGERFSLPLPKPVEKPKKDLPIPPYLLGFLLGDGYFGERKQSFSTADPEILDYLKQDLAEINLEFTKDTGANYYLRNLNKDYSSKARTFFAEVLDKLGLLGKGSSEKFIPKIYKEASVEQRFLLLQGLMDADGSADKGGGVEFSSVSESLAQDLQELVWSLGGVAKLVYRQTSFSYKGKKKLGKPSWRAVVSMPFPKSCFRLPRKRERLSEEHRRKRTLGPIITKIERAEDQEAQCIAIDHPDHLYIMDDYVVTHNSEFLVIDHFAMAACGLAVLFILPKYDLRNRFVQNRINKVVENVEAYRKAMGSGFFDSIQLKYFGRGTINYVGSNVEKDFYEIPTNAAIVDEYDHCDQNNLRFIPDRMSAVTNKYPFLRYSGNPKYPGRGINQLYLDSDRRVWKVPCKACGKLSDLDWFKCGVDIVYDKSGNVLSYNLKDTEWTPTSHRDAHLICECGGIMDRHSRKGIWVPTNPDGDGEGYLISKMFTRQASVAQLWKDFSKSVHNPGLMAWFYSSVLGIPPSGVGNRVTPDLMRSCAKVGAFKCAGNEAYLEETSEGPCSMGIDVGANLDVRISKVRAGKRVAQYIGKIRTKEELYELISRYNVEYAVIDAGPELHLVDEIQCTAPCPVWRCRFHAGEGKVQNVTYNTKEMEVRVDRTFIMDRAFAQLKTKKNLLPENFEDIIAGDYVNEMTASVRELVIDPNDNERYEWLKTEDHQWLADCYDLLASDFLEASSFDGLEVL